MAEQLAKRTTKQWVSQVLQQFNEKKISEKDACELLGIKRSRLYTLRKNWLRATLKGNFFILIHQVKIKNVLCLMIFKNSFIKNYLI